MDTFHAGIPEIFDDGTTGFLVDGRDVGGFADRLEALYDRAAAERRS